MLRKMLLAYIRSNNGRAQHCEAIKCHVVISEDVRTIPSTLITHAAPAVRAVVHAFM